MNHCMIGKIEEFLGSLPKMNSMILVYLKTLTSKIMGMCTTPSLASKMESNARFMYNYTDVELQA